MWSLAMSNAPGTQDFGFLNVSPAGGTQRGDGLHAERAGVTQAFAGRLAALLLGFACHLAVAHDFPVFQTTTARVYLLTVAQQGFLQAGTNADTYLILARAHGDLGESAEAERLAQEALTLDSRRADIQLFLARLLVRQDRMEEAIKHLREAVRLDSGLSGASRLLGMALERAGDSKGAEAVLGSELQRNPGDGEAGFLLGRLLLDQGRAQEAIACLERACQAAPASASGYYVLFQAQSSAGQAEAAQETFRRFQELKQREKAETADFEAAQSDERELRKFAAELHNELAAVLQRQGRSQEAEKHLRQALVVAPDQALAYERLAAVCARTGRLHEAEGFLTTLVRLYPREPSYGVNLGTVLLQLNDLPGAVREFERVLQAHPDEPNALNNLARSYLSSRQQLAEALALSRRLVTHQPTAAHYDLLGWALYLNGQTNEAIEACTQAIQRDSNNAAYRERLRLLQPTSRGGP